MLRNIVRALAITGLIACSSPSDATNNPDLVGEVTRITALNQVTGEVRLFVSNLSKSPEKNVTGLFLAANRSTPIFIRTASGLKTGTIEDIVVGSVIAAKVDDLVLDSLPPQYGATRIELPPTL